MPEWFKYVWCLPVAIIIWYAVIAFIKIVIYSAGGKGPPGPRPQCKPRPKGDSDG